MSGHSHAKTIAHQKAITDQKRGQIFSKMVRLITIAVREGGPNVETNYKLKVAIERARSFNTPNDNIERAIKQAGGGLEGKELNEFLFEAYGPGGIALIIEGITDNKNRTLGEIKQILAQYGGKLAQEGSVRWLFERKGVIALILENQEGDWKNKETLELKAIEAGAQDFVWRDDLLEIHVPVDNLHSTKASLEKEGAKIDSASADWVAKDEFPIAETDQNLAEKLFSALDENSDVQDTYSNLKD
ncbi:MAG: YebC/PmpR family DNA-binding transcriptional regulator [Candidatus Nealsonbacteria bacterium]|nr:YebC/PmpR family DNA-binding transcriptional regulator [Candidatus Nealsonbacteria bacterium]